MINVAILAADYAREGVHVGIRTARAEEDLGVQTDVSDLGVIVLDVTVLDVTVLGVSEEDLAALVAVIAVRPGIMGHPGIMVRPDIMAHPDVTDRPVVMVAVHLDYLVVARPEDMVRLGMLVVAHLGNPAVVHQGVTALPRLGDTRVIVRFDH